MQQTVSIKVGQLARMTGVSIRTLHYYDEIGLLKPSHHTESGHRVYMSQDIVRLQQIRSLQQLGFSLEEVQGCLDRHDFSLSQVIDMHLEQLRQRMELERKLCLRLEEIRNQLQSAEEVSVDDLLQTIEVMNMFENYYTTEQLETLKKRREEVGEERIREVEAEWPKLIEEVKAAMDAGKEPSDPYVQELAQRWMGLVNEFTGGDPDIERSLTNVYENEPGVQQKQGFDSTVFEYINKAMGR
ncbi:MAG: MerR family transcriptional regulator [Gemmataceae bacterium]